MTKDYIVFKRKDTGDTLSKVSLEGTFEGEIESTKELLAYDNGISATDIEVEVGK